MEHMRDFSDFPSMYLGTIYAIRKNVQNIGCVGFFILVNVSYLDM